LHSIGNKCLEDKHGLLIFFVIAYSDATTLNSHW